LKKLYIHSEAVHNLNAAREVVPIVLQLTKSTSVVDIGCGTGTWLKVFEENGVNDYLGVDGDYVERSMLKIPDRLFHAHDLTKPLILSRKFDIVISLEVAEHLPEQCANIFVESLVRHSDVILFSAAIPGQGGQHHLNEQWPEYWQKKFEQFGFYFHDVIRPEIWSNERVDFWYRQNIFLVKREKPIRNPFPSLSMVHPQLYQLKIQNEKEYHQSVVHGKQGIRISLTIFINSVKIKFRNLIGLK
jgi:SAM-dependent methyltransferase